MELLRTTRTLVTSDPERGTVTKTLLTRRTALRRLFLDELQVNRLLVAEPPPFPFARLLAADRRAGTMTFEAVPGPQYGPKFPDVLEDPDLDALVALARSTAAYRPRRRWLRRYAVATLVRRTAASGVLSPSAAHDLLRFDPGPYVFAHGDVTPRNVMRAEGGPVLIDFEWAGLYPAPYELAFLWFVLLDRPGGRERVEAGVASVDRPPFLFSALLVQLRHLQMWADLDRRDGFQDRHRATRDALLEEILDRASAGPVATPATAPTSTIEETSSST